MIPVHFSIREQMRNGAARIFDHELARLRMARADVVTGLKAFCLSVAADQDALATTAVRRGQTISLSLLRLCNKGAA